jgi:hypothetical protein
MPWSMNSNVTLIQRGRTPVRLLHALLTVPLVAGMTMLALAPAQASGSSSTTIKSSNIHKLVPGPGIGNAGSRVTLVQLKLDPGYSYHVELPVTVKHTNPDATDYVAVSLVCNDAAGNEDMIGQAVNTIHGTTFTLQPRLYITIHKKFASSNARGTCTGYAQATRIAGSSGAASSSRSLIVTSAKIIVQRSAADAYAQESVRFKGNNFSTKSSNPYAGHSSRTSKGVRFHAAPVAFTLNANKANTFALTSDVFLTSCTSTGGSRDATTNGKNLCTPAVVKTGGSGSLVRTRLIVTQYQANGTTACRTVVVPNTTKTFAITPHRHHLPVSSQGNVTLPVKAGCGSHVRAWTEVTVLRAPSVIVHFPSSVTTVLPI